MKPFATSCIVPVDARPTRAITVLDALAHRVLASIAGLHCMRAPCPPISASMASGAILTS